MRLHSNQRGFTLAELMVAVSSFSLLLLVCFGAFIFLGHLYYKGATEIKTNEIVRTVIEDMSTAIQFSGIEFAEVENSPDDGWRAYCIGHRKYSYRISETTDHTQPGVQLDYEATNYDINDPTKNKKANSVFVVSNIQGGCASGATPTDEQQYELLDERMRLVKFEVKHPDAVTSGKLLTLELVLAFGGDADDADVDNETFELNGGTIERCKSGQTFCSVARLKTTVYRKVGLR